MVGYGAWARSDSIFIEKIKGILSYQNYFKVLGGVKKNKASAMGGFFKK
jgi:hypothetical protein